MCLSTWNLFAATKQQRQQLNGLRPPVSNKRIYIPAESSRTSDQSVLQRQRADVQSQGPLDSYTQPKGLEFDVKSLYVTSLQVVRETPAPVRGLEFISMQALKYVSASSTPQSTQMSHWCYGLPRSTARLNASPRPRGCLHLHPWSRH